MVILHVHPGLAGDYLYLRNRPLGLYVMLLQLQFIFESEATPIVYPILESIRLGVVENVHVLTRDGLSCYA